MSETIRAFIAIELDEKARQELSLLQSKLKEEVNAKWIKPENMMFKKDY